MAQPEIKPRYRKVEFDLTTLLRMLTQGSEFRVKEGVPVGCILTATEIKGNAVVMQIQSVDFSDDPGEDNAELEIKLDEFRVGKGWS